MPFRPLTPKEKREIERKLREAEERVKELQGYAERLRSRLREGKWTSVEEE